MFSRIARLVALALPVLLACVIVTAGGWRIHVGRVERVSSTSAPVPGPVAPPFTTPLTPDQSAGPNDQVAFVHHLSPSVPWPVWAGLIVLCLLPAVASMAAWSGARRSRETRFSTF